MDADIKNSENRQGEQENQAGNILVTSISRKIPMLQAIGQAARKIDSRISMIGTDSDPEALGRYFVSRFRKCPPLEDLNDGHLLSLCQEFSVFAVIPSRDGELEYWSQKRNFLEAHGIRVMVSSPPGIQTCLDKYSFFLACRSLGIPAIPTSPVSQEITSPWMVVKERNGAGSKDIRLKVPLSEADAAAGRLNNPIFQPWIEGKEYSLDLYTSRNGKVMGTVARSRDLVSDGESQVTTIVRKPELEQIGIRLATSLGLYGHAVLQAIENPSGQLLLLECNARFGGASTLSLSAGLDSFYWFLLESRGDTIEDLPFHPFPRRLRQIRHPADFVYEVQDDTDL